jgi:hypothetical protein
MRTVSRDLQAGHAGVRVAESRVVFMPRYPQLEGRLESLRFSARAPAERRVSGRRSANGRGGSGYPEVNQLGFGRFR